MKTRAENGAIREDVCAYALTKYNTLPEYPWTALPHYAVFRRADNRKWYAVMMDVPKSKLGLRGEERIDILDIKCDSVLREILLCKSGFLPAYHLDRKNWITVMLDGSVDKDTVCDLIDESYGSAGERSKKTIRHTPTSLLVPVNPKYYDIRGAFAESDTILWKQSNTVIVGDTVYLYLAAPYSCVMYKCEATEVDIPYEYDDGKVRMHKVMRLKRLHTYDGDMFGLAVLKEHGIISVRGPRSVPYGLRNKLERASKSNNLSGD